VTGSGAPQPLDAGPTAPTGPPPHLATARRGLRLVPLRHDGLPGVVHALGPEGALCGRTRGQLRFEDDTTVSPEHARFALRADGVVVEDLGSANGTFLRVRATTPLAHGDEIRLGRQLLRVEPMPQGAAGTKPWGSADPGYRARLMQLLDGGGMGEVFPLLAGENAIGREIGQVCFPSDRYVSARHARIDVSATGMTLSDLGSSNGTFLRLKAPAPVGPGDQVLIGMQLVRVEAS
jgi:pSer/pThr/pTyr-binding forkhead associated (FHA) protein